MREGIELEPVLNDNSFWEKFFSFSLFILFS